MKKHEQDLLQMQREITDENERLQKVIEASDNCIKLIPQQHTQNKLNRKTNHNSKKSKQ